MKKLLAVLAALLTIGVVSAQTQQKPLLKELDVYAKVKSDLASNGFQEIGIATPVMENGNLKVLGSIALVEKTKWRLQHGTNPEWVVGLEGRYNFDNGWLRPSIYAKTTYNFENWAWVQEVGLRGVLCEMKALELSATAGYRLADPFKFGSNDQNWVAGLQLTLKL